MSEFGHAINLADQEARKEAFVDVCRHLAKASGMVFSTDEHPQEAVQGISSKSFTLSRSRETITLKDSDEQEIKKMVHAFAKERLSSSPFHKSGLVGAANTGTEFVLEIDIKQSRDAEKFVKAFREVKGLTGEKQL